VANRQERVHRQEILGLGKVFVLELDYPNGIDLTASIEASAFPVRELLSAALDKLDPVRDWKLVNAIAAYLRGD
jgi:hypothetical protein